MKIRQVRSGTNRTAGLVLMLMLLLVGAAEAAVEGTYRCAGTNPDGSQYHGRVVIQPAGEAYSLRWSIEGASHQGIAIFQDDILAASWGMPGQPGFGVVVYRRDSDGTLTGQWVGPNGGDLATETLTPIP